MSRIYLKSRAAGSSWIDAYSEWGLSLEDGSLGKLMAPAPNKEPIKNTNAVTHGSSIVGGIGKKAERTLSLELHFVARNGSYLDGYEGFCSLMNQGAFDMDTDVGTFHFLYLDCQQFSQIGFEIAKFTLTVLEPNPSLR